MNLKIIRSKILKEAKSYVSKKGWNDQLFINLSKTSKFKLVELESLFSGGKNSLIQIYLDEINNKMKIESKKLNLLRLRTHERIREIMILRLKIMLKEKNIVSKTFSHLLLPQNYKFATKNLYKTVDEIWFLAGDNSTDFNFYSKRIILGSIYSLTMLHFVNNQDINETIKFLDKQLKNTSYIPKLKNKTYDIIKIIPKALKFKKKFSFIKQ